MRGKDELYRPDDRKRPFENRRDVHERKRWRSRSRSRSRSRNRCMHSIRDVYETKYYSDEDRGLRRRDSRGHSRRRRHRSHKRDDEERSDLGKPLEKTDDEKEEEKRRKSRKKKHHRSKKHRRHRDKSSESRGRDNEESGRRRSRSRSKSRSRDRSSSCSPRSSSSHLPESPSSSADSPSLPLVQSRDEDDVRGGGDASLTANKEKPRSEKGDEDHQPLIIKAMDDEPRLQEGKDHPSLREDVAPTSTSASASAVLVSEVVETSSLLLTEDELLQIRASLIEQLTRSETDSRIEAALDAKVASVISSEVVLREFDNRLKNERQLMTQDMEAGLLAARQQALKHSEELRSRIKEKETELSRLEVDLRAAEAAWTKRKEIEAARKLEENLAQVERRQKEALELQAKQKEEQERIAREQKEVLGKGNTSEKLAFAFGSSSQKGPSKTLPRPFL